jgi:hypothetical protein
VPRWLKVVLGLFAASLVSAFIKEMGTGGSDGNAERPQAGDCFNNREDRAEQVSCDRPHDGEVFGSVTHPADRGTPYPSSYERDLALADRCVQLFGAYVGTALAESGLELFSIDPTEEEWEAGNREFACALGAPSGQLTESRRHTGSGEVPMEKSVATLGVGDCVMKEPAGGVPIYSMIVVPCDEPHDREVFALYSLSQAEYPGDEAIQRLGSNGCIDRFPAYVGESFEAATDLDLMALTPSSSSWSGGDRGVTCMTLHFGDDTPLTGSVRGRGG